MTRAERQVEKARRGLVAARRALMEASDKVAAAADRHSRAVAALRNAEELLCEEVSRQTLREMANAGEL